MIKDMPSRNIQGVMYPNIIVNKNNYNYHLVLLKSVGQNGKFFSFLTNSSTPFDNVSCFSILDRMVIDCEL